MIITPVISEKAMYMAEEENTYVFTVPTTANKIEVQKEIASRFKVNVTGVRTVLSKGKVKNQRVQGGRRILKGRRSDTKKAYVTLKSGDTISLFEGSK